MRFGVEECADLHSSTEGNDGRRKRPRGDRRSPVRRTVETSEQDDACCKCRRESRGEVVSNVEDSTDNSEDGRWEREETYFRNGTLLEGA